MFRIRFAAEIEAAAVHDANVLSMQVKYLPSIIARNLARGVITAPIINANPTRITGSEGTDEHK